MKELPGHGTSKAQGGRAVFIGASWEGPGKTFSDDV
jgi:hypothetical protein